MESRRASRAGPGSPARPSASEKPPTSTKRMRPASVSDTPLIRSQEALPSSRKTAFRFRSSQIGRRTSNSPGIRCTSSMTTRPSLRRSSLSGVSESAARVVATSRSKTVDGPGHADATCPARVVLPTCRAPSRATTGASDSASVTAASRLERAMDCCISDGKDSIYDNDNGRFLIGPAGLIRSRVLASAGAHHGIAVAGSFLDPVEEESVFVRELRAEALVQDLDARCRGRAPCRSYADIDVSRF